MVAPVGLEVVAQLIAVRVPQDREQAVRGTPGESLRYLQQHTVEVGAVEHQPLEETEAALMADLGAAAQLGLMALLTQAVVEVARITGTEPQERAALVEGVLGRQAVAGMLEL